MTGVQTCALPILIFFTDGAVKKIRRFRNNTKGVTTVEVILVLVVLLAIVVIFREQLTAIVTGIFSHVNSTVSELYG